MEMQDFLRYFPPMAALSVASLSGGHLLRDSAALSQNPQFTNSNTAQSPRTPAATDPNAHPRTLSPTHPANLTTTPEGINAQIATPEVVPPEGAMVDVEALLLASNEPYPIPDLPLPPSLSEVFAQTPMPEPGPVSLDPALLDTSVQALSDSPIEAMMAAGVASTPGASPEVAKIPEDTIPILENPTANQVSVAALANSTVNPIVNPSINPIVNPTVTPPEPLPPSLRDMSPIPEPMPSAMDGLASDPSALIPEPNSGPISGPISGLIPGNRSRSVSLGESASDTSLAAAPIPGANRPSSGILVASLPSSATGSALQLAPLYTVAAGEGSLEHASSAVLPQDISTETLRNSPQETLRDSPQETLRERPLEAAVTIPVPPPELPLADSSAIVAEAGVSTSPSPLPASPSPSPDVIAQAQAPSIAIDYTLGPGDRVFVDIFNVPEYSKSYQVMVDGTLSLPRIGRIGVAGLSLDQASALISDRYRQFFVEPLTTLVLEQARPVTVALSGEVNRPGSYQFNTTETGAFPTLTQAIRQAEGITQTADLRQVEIRRPQANGLEQVIEVNLWDLVQSSNLAQDITLRDGDMIRIAPAPTLSPTQRSQLAEANFAPATIRVNVIGEVVRPGVVEITPNTPLNQAVLGAGGFVNGRAKRQAVELIRLQPNGTVQRRTIAVDLAEGVNEATNPILQPNDVVLVARSNFARTTDAIGQVTAPTLFLLNLLRLF